MDVDGYVHDIISLEKDIRSLADAAQDFSRIAARFRRPVPPVLLDYALHYVDVIKANLLRLKAGDVGVKGSK